MIMIILFSQGGLEAFIFHFYLGTIKGQNNSFTIYNCNIFKNDGILEMKLIENQVSFLILDLFVKYTSL